MIKLKKEIFFHFKNAFWHQKFRSKIFDGIKLILRNLFFHILRFLLKPIVPPPPKDTCIVVSQTMCEQCSLNIKKSKKKKKSIDVNAFKWPSI